MLLGMSWGVLIMVEEGVPVWKVLFASGLGVTMAAVMAVVLKILFGNGR
jgi:hypothetical protein